jgi:hypothetical protein
MLESMKGSGILKGSVDDMMAVIGDNYKYEVQILMSTEI